MVDSNQWLKQPTDVEITQQNDPSQHLGRKNNPAVLLGTCDFLNRVVY